VLGAQRLDQLLVVGLVAVLSEDAQLALTLGAADEVVYMWRGVSWFENT
jgi:hypothetical protein